MNPNPSNQKSNPSVLPRVTSLVHNLNGTLQFRSLFSEKARIEPTQNILVNSDLPTMGNSLPNLQTLQLDFSQLSNSFGMASINLQDFQDQMITSELILESLPISGQRQELELWPGRSQSISPAQVGDSGTSRAVD
jgi:hypothetical protein